VGDSDEKTLDDGQIDDYGTGCYGFVVVVFREGLKLAVYRG
jgi:hypothetical protein